MANRWDQASSSLKQSTVEWNKQTENRYVYHINQRLANNLLG